MKPKPPATTKEVKSKTKKKMIMLTHLHGHLYLRLVYYSEITRRVMSSFMELTYKTTHKDVFLMMAFNDQNDS